MGCFKLHSFLTLSSVNRLTDFNNSTHKFACEKICVSFYYRLFVNSLWLENWKRFRTQSRRLFHKALLKGIKTNPFDAQIVSTCVYLYDCFMRPVGSHVWVTYGPFVSKYSQVYGRISCTCSQQLRQRGWYWLFEVLKTTQSQFT